MPYHRQVACNTYRSIREQETAHERTVAYARCWPRPALPHFDDDHIVTGGRPAHTGRSRRDRPQTARQPTISRGARNAVTRDTISSRRS